MNFETKINSQAQRTTLQCCNETFYSVNSYAYILL